MIMVFWKFKKRKIFRIQLKFRQVTLGVDI